MTPAVSVIIPTFNGSRRLPELLKTLTSQQAPVGGFEVIVVDNNSTDDTAKVARNDPSAKALRRRGVTYRLVSEERQGVTFARIRGATEAEGLLLCFLDDDNLPTQLDYQKVGIAALRDPGVGLLISRTEPRWECKPSLSVERRSTFFALTGDPANPGYLGDTLIDFGAYASIAPTNGAGMWVRREAFLSVTLCRKDNLLPGRLANGIGAGDDIEIGILIGKAGLRRLYIPQLRLTHCINESRLTVPALWRLLVGNLRSHFTVAARHGLERYGPTRRARGASRLAFAVLAAPAVMMVRRDGTREAVLIIAQRWAEVLGPWPAFARKVPPDTPRQPLKRGETKQPYLC